MKNNSNPPRGKKSNNKRLKFQPGTHYLIIKVASKPNSAFGSHVLTQERMIFVPKDAEEAVKFFQGVIVSTQENAEVKDRMNALSTDSFMKEFSDSFNGSFVPFHSPSSFVEKMIELEIFRKAELQ